MDVNVGKDRQVNVRVEKRAEGLFAVLKIEATTRGVYCTRSFPMSSGTPDELAKSFVIGVREKFSLFGDLDSYYERQISIAIEAEGRDPISV